MRADGSLEREREQYHAEREAKSEAAARGEPDESHLTEAQRIAQERRRQVRCFSGLDFTLPYEMEAEAEAAANDTPDKSHLREAQERIAHKRRRKVRNPAMYIVF